MSGCLHAVGVSRGEGAQKALQISLKIAFAKQKAPRTAPVRNRLEWGGEIVEAFLFTERILGLLEREQVFASAV